MSTDNNKSVKVDLTKEYLDRFLKVKKKLGIKADAEVFRYCLKQEYDRLFSDNQVDKEE